MNIPADIQFTYFKKIIPNATKIGVLYTDHTESLIPPARVVAASLDIELVPIRVGTTKDVPVALDSLARTVDGIWSVADPDRAVEPDAEGAARQQLAQLRDAAPVLGEEVVVDVDVADAVAAPEPAHVLVDVLRRVRAEAPPEDGAVAVGAGVPAPPARHHGGARTSGVAEQWQ